MRVTLYNIRNANNQDVVFNGVKEFPIKIAKAIVDLHNAANINDQVHYALYCQSTAADYFKDNKLCTS